MKKPKANLAGLKLALDADSKSSSDQCRVLLMTTVAELTGMSLALASIVEEVKAKADALCALAGNDNDQRGSEEAETNGHN